MTEFPDLRSTTVGISEAARRLGVSAQRLRGLIAEGRVQVVQTPLGKLIPVTEVERLQQERKEI